jgi:hypothetical protein
MKKHHKNGESYVDALERQNRYAVLTKDRRIQILVRPTTKQLRKRGQRGWQLYGTVENSSDASRALIDIVQRAVLDLESPAEPEVKDGKKLRAAKVLAKL